MKIRHYLITAALAYFTFLIYLAPAAPIVKLLINDNDDISVSTITGSLWSGNAESLSINNHELKDAQWSFTAWRLLTAEISFDINASYKNNPVSGSLGTSITGKRLLHDFTASIKAFEAGKLADILIGELDGLLNIQIDEASWTPGTVPEISGTIFWKKAAYIVAEKADLGDVTILFSKNDTSPLIANIENIPGHLSVKGDIAVNDEGHYQLGVSLKPTKDASRNLRNSLKLVAKPLPDGNFEINNAGELSTFGFM